jgi:hypothetical protein
VQPAETFCTTGFPASSSTICSPLPEITKMISSAPG